MSRLAGWFSLHYGGEHPGLGHVKLLPCHVERVAGVHFLPKSSSLGQNYCLKCPRQWQNWDVTKIQVLVCSWIYLSVSVLTCCIISSSTSSLYIAIGELYCLLASFCFPTWDQHPMNDDGFWNQTLLLAFPFPLTQFSIYHLSTYPTLWLTELTLYEDVPPARAQAIGHEHFWRNALVTPSSPAATGRQGIAPAGYTSAWSCERRSVQEC